jgi:glycosyltransferase involved in cell wall biosynthesis
MSLVTVIIPTRNYGCYISDALRSVLNQTYKPLEAIVVDDESTDCTAQTAAKFPVHYIYTKHVGRRNPCNAQNIGVKASKGSFIGLLGADDMLTPDYVKSCLAEMRGNVGFVWTGRQEFEGSNHVLLPDVRTLKHGFLYPDPSGALGGLIMKREALLKAGAFDVSLDGGEDWDMAIRICAAGYTGSPIMKPLYLCRMHGQQHGLGSLIKKYPAIRAYDFVYRQKHRLFHPFAALLNARKRVADLGLPGRYASEKARKSRS